MWTVDCVDRQTRRIDRYAMHEVEYVLLLLNFGITKSKMINIKKL